MYVFLDIDGTLVDELSTVFPESAQRACAAARANGHKLFLCTGRVVKEIYPWLLDDFEWDGRVTGSGAVAEIAGEEIVSHCFSLEQAKRITDYFDAHGVDYVKQSSQHIVPSLHYFEHIQKLADKWMQMHNEIPDLLDVNGAFFARYDKPSAEIRNDVRKLVFLGGTDLFAKIEAEFIDELHVVQSSVDVFGAGGGEVTLKGVNKGQTIVDLMAKLHVPMSETIGIGDSMNDLQMMQVCGTSVAMGNGRPHIKEAADYITTDINDNGIANAFAKLGLISAG